MEHRHSVNGNSDKLKLQLSTFFFQRNHYLFTLILWTNLDKLSHSVDFILKLVNNGYATKYFLCLH